MIHRKKTLEQCRALPAGSARSLCGQAGDVTPLTRKTTCETCMKMLRLLDRGNSLMRTRIPHGLPAAPTKEGDNAHLTNSRSLQGGGSDA